MTSNKTETAPAHAPKGSGLPAAAAEVTTAAKSLQGAATEKPARSVARGELNRRLVALEAAKAKVEEKQGAARRLAMMGETAKALAASLAGLKAQAAASLADHVLNGTGRPPKLSEDGREALAAKLAEAEATAEAAGPAIELVQVERPEVDLL